MSDLNSGILYFREIIAGHILIILSGITYAAYWIIDYYTRDSRPNALIALLFIVSLLSGLLGAGILVHTESGLSTQITRNFGIRHIVIIAAACFILSLVITSLFFHRQFTSEILFIFMWAGVEAVCLYVFFCLEVFTVPQFIISVILYIICLSVSMVCYVIHYSLEGWTRFINGLIPYGTVSLYMLLNTVILLYNRHR